MILPHFFAVHKGGEIVLNEEYDGYAWVPLNELEKFEPKIPTVFPIVYRLKALEPTIADKDLVET